LPADFLAATVFFFALVDLDFVGFLAMMFAFYLMV
jgi:hypothetical protein